MAWQDHSTETPLFSYAMLAAFVAIFLAQLTQTNLGYFYAYPWRVGSGQTWRLVTATLLHGSVLHFGFNMVFFLRFSVAIERWKGPWVAMGLYLLFALGSSAAQLYDHWNFVGASGAVYGCFAFLWVLRRRYDFAAEACPMQVSQTMLLWLGIGIVITFLGGAIASTAHVFGLLFGWLAGQVVLASRARRWQIAAATALLLAVLIAPSFRSVYVRTLAHVPFVGPRYAWVMVEEDEAVEIERHLAERDRRSFRFL